MKALLDTNVISELRKGDRADARVLAFAQTFDVNDLYLSVATIAEIQEGILGLQRRDAEQAEHLAVWRDHTARRFAGRLLSITPAIALEAARLHVPNRRDTNDAYIAATAIVHDMAMVTRNVKDFIDGRLDVINPWEF